MNFARLNHIWVPSTKTQRDRLRNTRAVRLMRWLIIWWFLLSDEGLTLLFLWLFVGVFSLNVGTTQFYMLWSMLSGVVLAAMIIGRFFPLTGVALEVSAPKRVVAGEAVQFTLTLTHRGRREHRSIRLNGPFLPWDGKWVSERPFFQTLLPDARQTKTMQAKFVARGEHHLDTFTAAALSPFGLGIGPLIRSSGVRFIVVPRPAPVREIRLPLAYRYQPGGIALASRTGESRELIGIRPYRPGDPMRDLHAASFARLGAPMVREYRQEYFTRVGIVVATEQPASEAQFEAGVSLAAGLVTALARGDVLIDLLILGKDVHALTVGRSLGCVDQTLDLLACVERPSGRALRQAPYPELAALLHPHLDRLSCVVAVSLKDSEDITALGAWIQSRGVGFKEVLIGGSSAPLTAAHSAVRTVVSPEAIAGEEELFL